MTSPSIGTPVTKTSELPGLIHMSSRLGTGLAWCQRHLVKCFSNTGHLTNVVSRASFSFAAMIAMTFWILDIGLIGHCAFVSVRGDVESCGIC